MASIVGIMLLLIGCTSMVSSTTKTYYLDNYSGQCGSSTTYNVQWLDKAYVYARRSLVRQSYGYCRITFRSGSSSEPRLKVSFSAINWSWYCGSASNKLKIYDSTSTSAYGTKLLKQVSCGSVPYSTYVTSGRYMTIELTKSLFDTSNFNFRMTVEPTAEYNTNVVGLAIGGIIGIVVSIIVVIVIAVVVIVFCRLAARRRYQQTTTTLVTNAAPQTQVISTSQTSGGLTNVGYNQYPAQPYYTAPPAQQVPYPAQPMPQPPPYN